MKQYVIDELRPRDYSDLKAYLDRTYGTDAIQGVYWIPIAQERLSETQHSHSGCQPFYFALELEPERLACELLVRTKNRVRCDCIAYANVQQRNWIMGLIDTIFEELAIRT